jgi:Kef-type K+ transport system membrane component KefB
VLLLVGVTGADLNFATLRRSGATAFRVSLASLLVPLGLGVAAGFLLPAMLVGEDTERLTFALFLGVAMCVSAIPVLAKILMDMRLHKEPLGQLILIAGVIDDAFGWVLLSFVSALATVGLTAASIGSSLAGLAVIVLVALVVGRPLVRLVLDRAGRSGEPIPVLGAAVVLVLLSAAGTQAMGQEPVLGAFLCGMLISASGKLPETSLAPLRTFVLAILAPVFFALAGLRMDLRLLADPRIALTGLAVLAVAIVGKFAGAYLGARLSRLNRWEGLALGAGLNARGVVQVIIATIGVRLGVLNAASYTIIVLVALATSMLTPPLLRFALARVEREAAEPPVERPA